MKVELKLSIIEVVELKLERIEHTFPREDSKGAEI